ncbi:MAG: helix-turn-helix domain-containing protein [Gaiellaceae bacterium]
MFEIGSSLRQARQQRGLGIADVERETHIRAKYLGALEDERFDVLPGQAYVRGFLRTYADFLGLNGGLYVDEYNEKFAPPDEELPPIQHRAQHRRELRLTRPAAGALVALAAGTVVVWQLGFSSPQRTQIPQTRLVGHVTAAAPTRHAAAKPKRQAAATTSGPATLVVRASRGNCWVAVRVGSSSGPVLYERVLAQGGTLRFGLRKKLWVRLGAPWNADVTLRGKALGALPHAPLNLTAA